MPFSSQPERPDISRRSVLRTGAGLAVGAGALGATVLGATPAAAAQRGTPLVEQPGDSASRQGVGSSDLCIPYYREHDGSWGYVFGDTWAGPGQSGTMIGSPVMLAQDRFDASGGSPISFTWALPSGGQPSQLFDYRRGEDNGYGDTEVTRIPNDCIEFGGRTYIQYTSVFTWTPPPGWDGSLMSGVAYSDDHGVTWHDYPYHWPGDRTGGNQSMYGMWSFAGIDPDGWLYIFSKRWNGTHINTGDGGAIQLFRIRPGDFRAGNFGAQQNWAYLRDAWQWTNEVGPTAILTGNKIGEFSVKRIGNRYCMSYFDVDEYAICTRTASRPDAVWTAPKIQVVGNNTWPASHWGKPQVPTLYGGYIHPGSASATSLTLIVSQWNGQPQQAPYRVLQYDGINP
ncbi:DUF4185 domain-containing protein [Streptomyces sp. NBC_00454]|uniref:DUF4185 domain-containing protein n=1 Tax=Streptomyces sp. NBC_00454 TaxID=2975747 RepID=UPI0030E428AB